MFLTRFNSKNHCVLFLKTRMRMFDMFSLRYLDVWPKNSQKEKTKPEKVFGRLGLYIQVFSKNYWGIRGRFPCLIHILQMASKPPAKNTVFFLWPVDSFRRDSRRRCETASQTWRGLDVPGLLKWMFFFLALKFKVWGSNRCIWFYIFIFKSTVYSITMCLIYKYSCIQYLYSTHDLY